jgi:hypothetical protein
VVRRAFFFAAMETPFVTVPDGAGMRRRPCI